MTSIEHKPPIYGVMAEFRNSDDLVDACKRAREAGYRKMDAYTPVPVEELHDVLHLHDDGVSLLDVDRRADPAVSADSV